MGVDSLNAVPPEDLRPGIGLRPGGERPDLETEAELLYLALYRAARAQAINGLNVVMDVGHHDSFSQPLRILPKCASLVADLDAYFFAVRCPLHEVMRLRVATNMVCSRRMLVL